MIQSKNSYKEYLNKLKKSELINIINDYNKLCNIYGYEKINDTKSKKEVLVKLIEDVKDNYIKGIIMCLDVSDYNSLKKGLKKMTLDNMLLNYLNNKHIVWNNELPSDISLNEVLKDKTIIKHIKHNDRIYKLIDGIVIAYGTIDIKYFHKLIENIEEKENIPLILEFYYKKDYVIDNTKIVSKKLSNKKKIDKYCKDKKYKEFTEKEYIELGSSIYHHNIKSYKRFIKILKNYYVFKKNDIKFVDDNIVIPYLYNNINEEKAAKIALEEVVEKLFEFKSDKLKIKMITEIEKIRDEFPLWEMRGFSKSERQKNE